VVIGSVLFGLGWGLAGICPGPAVVVAGMGLLKGGVFVLAMLLGMAMFELAELRQAKSAARPDTKTDVTD
jgi:uncharacterized membrane protein YedE/YeeE